MAVMDIVMSGSCVQDLLYTMRFNRLQGHRGKHT